MSTIVADFELVCSSDPNELWVITPTAPLLAWPTIRQCLPTEVQDFELDPLHPDP